MPNLAQYHPQIVHFVVALLFVGVALRIASLIPKLKFANHAAALLLLIGTRAAVLAVQSGTDAHGPVERIPGTRALVVEHEEVAIQAKNIFLAVAALELIALGLARPSLGVDRYARVAQVASVVAGLYGSLVLYHASEHGGELVYSYAGGPGLRTGRPADVERLLLAGLYNQSREDRKAGRLADAAVSRRRDGTAVSPESGSAAPPCRVVDARPKGLRRCAHRRRLSLAPHIRRSPSRASSDAQSGCVSGTESAR
jgi:uncharacterized membrane protein